MDLSDLFPELVRAKQAIHQAGHLLLVNWGLWSRDRAGIFPHGVAPPHTWDEACGGLPDGYATEGEGQQTAILEPAKAEAPEDDPYDELRGLILDERIHSPGGPNQSVREALRIAYVRRGIHEIHYPRAAGCTPDAFLERLESGLMFAGRWV